MSGICSKHRDLEPSCQLCKADVRDLVPDYARLVDEAERAGTRVCAFGSCRFVFYRTTNCCPLCGRIQPEERT
jgi:hypothetical protein